MYDDRLIDKMVQRARKVSFYAKPKISNYHVGVCILDENGNYHLGCNIETDIHQAVHAEVAGITNMVLNKGTKISVIAVYTKDNPPWYPCGLCRQWIWEFGDKDTLVVACNDVTWKSMYIKDLFPDGFKRDR